MGTNVLYTADLQGKPTAMTTVYESTLKPMLPMIAIAIEHQVYFYRDFAPHMRFDLPLVKFSDEEAQYWKELEQVVGDDEDKFVEVTEKLFNLRESGIQISALSSELISFEDIR